MHGARRRGLLWLVLAILLLVVALILFGALRPAVGERYSYLDRAFILGAASIGVGLLLRGTWRVVLGGAVAAGAMKAIAFALLFALGLAGSLFVFALTVSTRGAVRASEHGSFDWD